MKQPPILTPAQTAILRALESWTLDLPAAALAWRPVDPVAAAYAEALVVPRFRTTRKGRAYLELLVGRVTDAPLPWSPSWVLAPRLPQPRKPRVAPAARRLSQVGYYATAEEAATIWAAAAARGVSMSELHRRALASVRPGGVVDTKPTPKGPDAVHLACRLTTDEYRHAAESARAAGVSLAAWCRHTMRRLVDLTNG